MKRGELVRMRSMARARQGTGGETNVEWMEIVIAKAGETMGGMHRKSDGLEGWTRKALSSFTTSLQGLKGSVLV